MEAVVMRASGASEEEAAKQQAALFMQPRGRSETGLPVAPSFLPEVHLLRAIFYFGLMDWSDAALGLQHLLLAHQLCSVADLHSVWDARLNQMLF